ncbi:MAG: glutathione peroxidase [Ginsengibacter sp.]
MKLSKAIGAGRTYSNDRKIKPATSFYSLQASLNSGEIISMEKYKGKKVLIVNLASQCGFTRQYEELEMLHQQNKQVVVLGFPSNNFGGQERGSDEEIASFCKVNYGVTFPIFKKYDVKGSKKQSVYAWLSDKNKNGWNDLEPKWNFYKYLLNENGELINIYSSSVQPGDIPL